MSEIDSTVPLFRGDTPGEIRTGWILIGIAVLVLAMPLVGAVLVLLK